MMMDGWIERVRRGSMGSEEGAPVGGGSQALTDR